MRRPGVLILIICAVLGLVVTPVSAGVVRYEGEIDGARYRVMVPSNWNGTFVLWSHGAYGAQPSGIALTSQPATEDWLLAQGYALGASQFRTPVGWSIEDGLRDQVKLLDWFRRTIGKPRRTISAGESIGGATATVLAERNPQRFNGVMTLCGAIGGGTAHWNSGLDLMFALRTLFGADIELVKIKDPAANQARAIELMGAAASGDPLSQARLALAAALADIPGWFDPAAPRPVDVASQVFWMGFWGRYFRSGAAGSGRTDMERWAGGNPSWNVGVDYRAVLARSSEFGFVKQAYAAAGADLAADLSRLAAAPRIAPDPAAVGYLTRTSVPFGFTPWPVVTVHNTADGTTPYSHDSLYASRAWKPENLRQYAINRAGHCIFTASEEITAFQTLIRRLDTGRWPSADPATLNAAARSHGPEAQLIRNILTGGYEPSLAAFAPHNPGRYPRAF
jgi:pimeloyl-ACP methyl ester carboxylesterase